jgi:hypothetical protein
MEFSADLVWALAVNVDRISPTAEYTESTVRLSVMESSKANRVLIKQQLQKNDFSMVSSEDVTSGQQLRHLTQGWLMSALAGNSTILTEIAISAAAIDVFTGSHLWEIAVVAAMPKIHRTIDPATGFPHALAVFEVSEPPVGEFHQKISGEMVIMKCIVSSLDNRGIVARFNQTLVYFWHDGVPPAGKVVQFTATLGSPNWQGLTRLRQVKFS